MKLREYVPLIVLAALIGFILGNLIGPAPIDEPNLLRPLAGPTCPPTTIHEQRWYDGSVICRISNDQYLYYDALNREWESHHRSPGDQP